jgi:formate dehydrogenase major subunit
MSEFQIVVNRTSYTVPAEGSVLDALRWLGVRLPALCHDDRLTPTGACRLCLVHVTGWPKPVAACTTALCDGMEIETASGDLEDVRRTLLAMLLRRYPANAVERFPEKPFHRAIRDSGVIVHTQGRLPGVAPDDGAHPYIAVDMQRCIQCERCVRICDDLQGQFVWHVRGRGLETTIEPDGPTLRDSPCVGCGACVDTCPTGALEDRTASPLSPPTERTRTVCPYCGVGCEMSVGTCRGRIVSVTPVLDSPVSRGHLCVKGRYAFDFVTAADRVTTPMLRDGSDWRRVSWSEARAFVTSRLRRLIEQHGPDSIGILGSARTANEDNYVTQKFARTVIGTNNVDCCARVCHAPSAAALKRALGAGLATNSYDDIERAAAFLVCGANPTESHPVLGARIKQAVRRGARLVVLDPRRIELAGSADVHLAIRPGTNIVALNAMARTIVAERLYDPGFVAARVSQFDAFAAHVEPFTAERAAATCGVAADAIRAAARLYATTRPAMAVHGLGLTEHVQGTDGVLALINLALLTGNVGRPGSGVNPLRGQNNVQGAAHMGCDPAVLPGSIPLASGRHAFEQAWGTSLPITPGLTMVEMMDAAAAGRVKGLWAIGYDVLATNPNVADTSRALQSLELVIVQDLFLTETARQYASVFLPACSSFERDGTFMNAERRIQRVRAALPPYGASKPDWQIVCEIARAMGSPGFGFGDVQQIWDEIRGVCDGARGMTYARLDVRGLQWPCPAEDHPGTTILHCDAFASGQRASLHAVDYQPTFEVPSSDYPLELVTGRSLYQFNTGSMTGRTRNNELRPTDVLDISPADAEAARVSSGDPVRIISRYGSVVLPAHVDTSMATGQLFATFQDPHRLVNLVTSGYRDRTTGTPEYKITAVRLERVAG